MIKKKKKNRNSKIIVIVIKSFQMMSATLDQVQRKPGDRGDKGTMVAKMAPGVYETSVTESDQIACLMHHISQMHLLGQLKEVCTCWTPV